MIKETPEGEIIIEPNNEEGLSDYAIFAYSNVGYRWVNKKTGYKWSYGMVYCVYCKSPLILDQFTNNTHPEFTRVKNGEYPIGVLKQISEILKNDKEKHGQKC